MPDKSTDDEGTPLERSLDSLEREREGVDNPELDHEGRQHVERARTLLRAALDDDYGDDRANPLQQALDALQRVETEPSERAVPNGGTDEDNPLAAVARARSILEDVDTHRVGVDDADARLLNALEQLDGVLLDASADEFAGANATPTSTDAGRVRGPGETPEDVVEQRLEDADRDETVPVTVEFPAPLVALLDVARVDDETTTDFVERVVRMHLSARDSDYWNTVPVDVEVELPEETARWAQAWADYRLAQGSDPADVEIGLEDYLDLHFTYHVEGGGEIDVGREGE